MLQVGKYNYQYLKMGSTPCNIQYYLNIGLLALKPKTPTYPPT